jgi:cell division transport system permease protein
MKDLVKRFLAAPTIPLDRDATGRFLPAVVAIMVLLASLLLVCAMSLGEGLRGWRGSLEGHATVQILPLDERTTPLQERVDMALGILRSSAGVKSAAALPADKMAELLSPWLGEGELPEDLPIPALIDVQLNSGTIETAQLAEALKPVAGATIDDHGSWLGEVRKLARLVVGLSYALVALIIGAAALIVILLVRAGMAMHRDVVELLHMVGASDGFIAWQFQRHMSIVALQGAAGGSFLAVVVLHYLGSMAKGAGLDLLATLAPGPNLLALVLVAFGFIALAAVTSGVIARSQLADLP